VETIRALRPHVLAKGPDYRDFQKDRTGGIALEEAAIREVGGQLVITEDVTFSSTHLINHYLPTFPKEVATYLSEFRSRRNVEDVLKYIEGARNLRTLVIGEAIIDEYAYVQAIGKSGKEPVLATRYMSTERFAGGILAVANHVAGFCRETGVLTAIGETEAQEAFVRGGLKPNVTPYLIPKPNSPTIVKRRYVEGYLLQKLFEVYVINDEDLPQPTSAEVCSSLERVLPQYDVVIVADYGHGFMTKDVVNVLCDKARFLAVNTQANAGNWGLNTISKYPRADYISLAQQELSLETRKKFNSVQDQILSVSEKTGAEAVMVTRGKAGSICWRRNEGFHESPALASQVVDRVGAGDAVLPMTALCIAQKAPLDIVGLVGNAAGSMAVATMGHRSSIEHLPLVRYIESLLK
jgi:bifunctional ADP-heptose synthase (sugar kinase/adenylyltransferase)